MTKQKNFEYVLKGGKMSIESLRKFLDATFDKSPPQIIKGYNLDNALSNEFVKVYYNPSNKRAIVAHRGTYSLDDAWTDAKMVFGFKNNDRFKIARETQEKANLKYGPKNISIIGFSLGATLAQENLKPINKEAILVSKPVLPLDIIRPKKKPFNQFEIRSSLDPTSMLKRFEPYKTDIVVPAKTYNPSIEHQYNNILSRLPKQMIVGYGIKSKPNLYMTDFGKFKTKDLRDFIKKNRKGQSKQYLIGGCRKCDLVKMAQALEGGARGRPKEKIDDRDEVEDRYIYCGANEKLPKGYKVYGRFDECYKKGQVKRYGRYKFDSRQYKHMIEKDLIAKKGSKESLMAEYFKYNGQFAKINRELKELKSVVDERQDTSKIAELTKQREDVLDKLDNLTVRLKALEKGPTAPSTTPTTQKQLEIGKIRKVSGPKKVELTLTTDKAQYVEPPERRSYAVKKRTPEQLLQALEKDEPYPIALYSKMRQSHPFEQIKRENIDRLLSYINKLYTPIKQLNLGQIKKVSGPEKVHLSAKMDKMKYVEPFIQRMEAVEELMQAVEQLMQAVDDSKPQPLALKQKAKKEKLPEETPPEDIHLYNVLNHLKEIQDALDSFKKKPTFKKQVDRNKAIQALDIPKLHKLLQQIAINEGNIHSSNNKYISALKIFFNKKSNTVKSYNKLLDILFSLHSSKQILTKSPKELEELEELNEMQPPKMDKGTSKPSKMNKGKSNPSITTIDDNESAILAKDAFNAYLKSIRQTLKWFKQENKKNLSGPWSAAVHKTFKLSTLKNLLEETRTRIPNISTSTNGYLRRIKLFYIKGRQNKIKSYNEMVKVLLKM